MDRSLASRPPVQSCRRSEPGPTATRIVRETRSGNFSAREKRQRAAAAQKTAEEISGRFPAVSLCRPKYYFDKMKSKNGKRFDDTRYTGKKTICCMKCFRIFWCLFKLASRNNLTVCHTGIIPLSIHCEGRWSSLVSASPMPHLLPPAFIFADNAPPAREYFLPPIPIFFTLSMPENIIFHRSQYFCHARVTLCTPCLQSMMNCV